MGVPTPDHDMVRHYLDSAVAEAADRWVGRATDATAYADLVAAVLARREALLPGPGPSASTVAVTRAASAFATGTHPLASPTASSAAVAGTPYGVASPAAPVATPPAEPVQPRHVERRSRPRWPSLSRGSAATPVERSPEAVALPQREPGRHRIPQLGQPITPDIDLTDGRLTTVLDWLGRPDTGEQPRAD